MKKNFFQEMGYNCPETGFAAQMKMLAQLLMIGAIMTLPLLAIMAIAGWMDQMSKNF